MKEVISSNDAPAAIGPYSQATRHGDMVFLSGNLPIEPVSGNIPADIQGQTRQVLTNMQDVLAAAGCAIDDVVKTTCFLADMALFQDMNAVYAEFFTSAPPARATVAAKALPRDVLVEIEAIAIRKR